MNTTNEPMDVENGRLATLPVEILLNIFAKTNAMDLLNLSGTCRRFEVIAPIAFQNKYHAMDFTFYVGGSPDSYAALVERFGGDLRAIQLYGFEEIGGTNDWISALLHRHINALNTLTLQSCTFMTNDFLSQSMANLTHLTFRKDVCLMPNEDILLSIELPECGNLIRFEYRGCQCISTASLQRMISRNPSLRSLLLYDCLDAKTAFLDEILTFLPGNLNELRELAMVDEWYGEWHRLPHESIDRICNSLRNLELLAISIDSNAVELVKRIGWNCSSVTQLELYPSKKGFDCKILKDVCSPFQHIEHLHVFQFSDGAGVFDVFFELLHKCQGLQTVSYHIDRNARHMPIETELYGKFFEVIRIINKPNAKIEVKCDDEIMIAMSKNGVTFMNGCCWEYAE